MKTKFVYKIVILIVLTACLFTASCLQNQSVRSSRTLTDIKSLGSGNVDVNGDGAAPGEDGGGTLGGLDDVIKNGKAELRHLINPFDGTYKTKITIPKNFTGLMYLSGLNVTSLSSQIVYVRFSFGRELEPVTIQGTIGRAPGIIPQTDIEVIILDIRGKPFENIRLLYDIFDYTDYRDKDGVEFGSNVESGTTISLMTNPRDSNLYCRGLKLEHDPTFVPTLDKPLCNYSGARCLYTYGKLKDTGLYDSSGIAISASEPQIDLGGSGYVNDSKANQLKKCLPDNNVRDNLRDVLGLSNDSVFNGSGYGINVTFPDTNVYTYNGPFRAIAPSEWGISGSAIWSSVGAATDPTGLFQSSWGNSTGDLYKDYVGYKSFMFPRSGNMSLSAGVEHFSSSSPFKQTSRTSLVSSGDSGYMDGCNIRVSNYDSYINEGISSCNVSAKIEILAINQTTGAETVLADSTDLKLQLIRSSNTDYQGNEVLYSSMKTCTNSQACGAGECCYNSRCWAKSLVTRCLEDVESTGNGGTGAVCSSDYECSSLCCNSSTGRCSVHVNNSQDQVLCSKSPGQTCVTKEWCRRDYVNTCYIVKTGISETGKQNCEIRCYQIPTFGDCVNGSCVPPQTPAMPMIDETASDSCKDAIDPPLDFN